MYPSHSFLYRSRTESMFLVLFLFLGLAVVTAATSVDCTYSQSYWISNTSIWPGEIENRTMCGASWHQLMQIESIRLARTSQWMWLVAFHQMATYTLNSANSSPAPPRIIRENALLLHDSLSRACDNMSQWGMTSGDNITLLYQLVESLQHYNSVNPCDGISASNTWLSGGGAAAAYYELNTPDRIVVVGWGVNSTNNSTVTETMILAAYSLLSDTYHKRDVLTGLVALAYLVIIPGLVCAVVMLKNMRRKLFVKRAGNEYEGGRDKHLIEGFITTDENGRDSLNINGDQFLKRTNTI